MSRPAGGPRLGADKPSCSRQPTVYEMRRAEVKEATAMADSDLNDLIRRIAYYLDDQLVDEPEKIARELIAAGYRRPSPVAREGDVVIPRDRLVALVEWAEQQASHAFRVKDGEKVGNAFVEM